MKIKLGYIGASVDQFKHMLMKRDIASVKDITAILTKQVNIFYETYAVQCWPYSVGQFKHILM
jgi:hypothetical protein